MKLAFRPYEKALMALVRLHLHTADVLSLPDDTFALTDDEWAEVYALACSQGVKAIVCDAVKSLPKDCQPPTSLMQKWTLDKRCIVIENNLRKEVLADLCRLCHSNGLQPVLLKGFTLARYYPQPDFRESGDFDLWFPDHEAESDALFATMVEGLNYDNAKHTTFSYYGVDVENHQTLLDHGKPYTHINDAIEEQLRAYWREEPPVTFPLPQDESVMMPSTLFTILMMARHQTAHLSYKFVLRHIVDWGLIIEQSDRGDVQAVLGQIDDPQFNSSLRIVTLLAQTALGLGEGVMDGYTASERRRARRLLIYIFRPLSLQGYRRGTLRYYPKALQCLWRTSWFSNLGTGENRLHFMLPFFLNKLFKFRKCEDKT